MGPNYSISTACATANYCFVAAANHIRNGDADMVLAGGSEAPIIPVGLGGFVACRYARASCSALQYPSLLPWTVRNEVACSGVCRRNSLSILTATCSCEQRLAICWMDVVESKGLWKSGVSRCIDGSSHTRPWRPCF